MVVSFLAYTDKQWNAGEVVIGIIAMRREAIVGFVLRSIPG
jgi:hypothetical protein